MAETIALQRVLIVDDDEDLCGLMCMIAEEAGFLVTFANNGAGFKAAYKTCSPQLVISDLAMPDYDGLELLRFLSEQGYKGDVIVASSHDAKVLNQVRPFAEMLGLEIRGVLAKPFESKDFLALLQGAEATD